MPVPKLIHFCFGFASDFGHKPWSLVHYVSVASAIRKIKPDKAFIYFEYEPEGPWWELSRSLLEPVHTRAPREVFGNPVIHPAHRADIVRLQILLDHGGIYLDTDVFVHRSFDAICDGPAVLGRQGTSEPVSAANAVLLAERGSDFIKMWLDAYRSFRSRGRDIYWDEHSVRVPAILAQRYPQSVRILPHTAFYWPLWFSNDLKLIFGPTPADIISDDTFATHLWETHAWSYLENLTPGQVRRTDTNFSKWARPYVSGLPDDFGAPTLDKWIYTQLNKPKLAVRSTSQKLLRGMKLAIRGRGAPPV